MNLGPEQDPTTSLRVEDVIAEMDELGRAKWDAALARVEAKQLRAELARIINEHQQTPHDPPAVVPAN